MSVDNSSWSIERDYPHPPERVFTAWAEPGFKVRWFDLSGHDNPDYRGASASAHGTLPHSGRRAPGLHL